MSLALYRKYRPGRFDDIIGQEHVTEPLKRALAAGRTHHAYLFSGPRGCGKTSSARILARSLNCAVGPTPDPCGECDSCRDLAPNGPGSIDVVELDAATHGLVDDARDLREKAVYAPAASRFKVYIIDEAHQLGPGAANALLKLVEEPPPHVRFVFATTEPDKIITTIRSRTHHYAFRLVPRPILLDLLRTVCAEEDATVDEGALELVVRAAAGSVRDALSILGQLLAGAADTGLTTAAASRLLGVTDEAAVDAFIEGLATADTATMLQVVGAVVDQGLDPRRFVTDVLDHLRDLIVVQLVPAAGEHGLVSGEPERVQRLTVQAEQFEPGALNRYADLTSVGLTSLRGATAPRLQLELLAARLSAAGSAPSGTNDRDLRLRLDRLERLVHDGPGTSGVANAPPQNADPQTSGPNRPRRISEVAPSTARPGAAPTPRRAAKGPEAGASPAVPDTAGGPPATDAAPTGPSPTFDQVQALWPAVLERTKGRSRVAWMLIAGAQPRTVEGGLVTAAHPDGGMVARFRSSPHRDLVGEAITGVVGASLRLELIHDPGVVPEGDGQVAPAAGGTRRRSRPVQEAAPRGEPSDAFDAIADSSDDDGLVGLALVERELGAVKIAERDEA